MFYEVLDQGRVPILIDPLTRHRMRIRTKRKRCPNKLLETPTQCLLRSNPHDGRALLAKSDGPLDDGSNLVDANLCGKNVR